MNPNDSFSAGLVIYTRQLLLKNHSPTLQIPHIGDCVFRMQPHGTFHPKPHIVQGLAEWGNYVRKSDITDIWLRIPQYGDTNYLGFANCWSNTVVCRRRQSSFAFDMRWDFNSETSLWTVMLAERFEEENARPCHGFSRSAYTGILAEMADFAAFLDEPYFEGQFRAAVAALSNIEAPAQRGELQTGLPWPFSGVWNAAVYASVIGGMGSWNDVPQGKAVAKNSGLLYQRLTNELVRQNRLAVLFAVNEFDKPKSISCEIAPKHE